MQGYLKDSRLLLDYPGWKWSEPVKTTIGELLGPLRWVAKAMSMDVTRPYLNGVCFAGESLVTTDGARLHVTRSPVVLGGTGRDEGVILPADCVGLLVRALAEYDTSREIEFQTREGFMHISLPLSGSSFTFCLQEGVFPPWQQVIPDAARCDVQFQVPARKLRAIVKNAGSERGVISLETGESRWLSFSIYYAEKPPTRLGECGRTLTRWNRPESTYRVAFNHRYLLDALTSKSKCTVTISTEGGELDPILVSLDEGTSCVIMPMRI